tara:strand:- start:68 stop:901 length:834 start_codon:yes stop_codon:yes gene_type:complete
MKKIKTISIATLTMALFFSILSYAFIEKFESNAQIYIKDKFSDTSVDANITSFLGNQDLGIFDQKDISNKIFLDQILSKSFFYSFIGLHPKYISLINENDPTFFHLILRKDISETIDKMQPKNKLRLYNKFKKIFSVQSFRQSDSFKLSITTQDPKKSYDLLSDLLKFYDDEKRNYDLVESNQRIDFYREKALDQNVVEIKQAISTNLEKELLKNSLIQTDIWYTLSFVDYPLIPEKKKFPTRSLFLLFGLIFGFFSSFLLVNIANIKSLAAKYLQD